MKGADGSPSGGGPAARSAMAAGRFGLSRAGGGPPGRPPPALRGPWDLASRTVTRHAHARGSHLRHPSKAEFASRDQRTKDALRDHALASVAEGISRLAFLFSARNGDLDLSTLATSIDREASRSNVPAMKSQP